MLGSAPLTFECAHAQVELMIRFGSGFAQVEEAIDAAPFSQDHKAALWLLAWSLRDPALQRRDATMMARNFAATPNPAFCSQQPT